MYFNDRYIHIVGGIGSFGVFLITSNDREHGMSKSQDAKKTEKKEPLKSPKEKKAEKKIKKEERKRQ
jgi:hypothetical protein